MTYSVTVAQMRSHVRQLCEANRIAINYDRHASASYREREIWIRALGRPAPMPSPFTRLGTSSAVTSSAAPLSFGSVTLGIGQGATAYDGLQRCGGTRIGASNTTRGKSLFRNTRRHWEAR